MPDFADGLLWYLVFLFSTVCHEAAHAWVALRLGDDTAYRGGQVSFNPLPHIRREPFGMVVVPLIAFMSSGWMIGWASAPYNPQWALRWPRRAAIMALAGPAANLALVLLVTLILRAGVAGQVWEQPDFLTTSHLAEPIAGGLFPGLAKVLSIAFSLNLLLFAFNLLPLPSLDGSSFPLLFLPGRLAQGYLKLLWNPALQLVGLVLAWRGFPYVYEPIRRIAREVLYLAT